MKKYILNKYSNSGRIFKHFSLQGNRLSLESIIKGIGEKEHLYCCGPSSMIKEAIQKIFKVKVTKVNTSILRGKIKSFKGSVGYRKDTKKAIVTLAEGNTIDSSIGIK